MSKTKEEIRSLLGRASIVIAYKKGYDAASLELVAEKIGVTPRTVYGWRSTGKIPRLKLKIIQNIVEEK